jgi:U3 small nucleolar RNA-associated protein 12
LELYELSTLLLIEKQKGHLSQINSIIITPDKKNVISISSDKFVKFWGFEITKDKKLSISIEHVLEMNEEILSVACSPDSKYLAVSLLDSTIKVFFLDSLKFYLSLYGHKVKNKF